MHHRIAKHVQTIVICFQPL